MRILVTGSAGLVGSQAVAFFKEKKWEVVGIDNNNRSKTLGTPSKVLENDVDITNLAEVELVFKTQGPFDAVIHSAAQPSHDYSKEHVIHDFNANALGTVNLLEATRKHSPKAVFVHCSTDKVYGWGMNRENLQEESTRYTHDVPFDETTKFATPFSPFGVSKLYADFIAQEYAKQGWLTTGVFRMGCITGAGHEGAEMHGFLAYLAKCVKSGTLYHIFGYKGKQVRDQIHAWDLVNVFYHFIQNPRSGEVYNIGGGPERSVSIIEAGSRIAEIVGKPWNFELIKEPRFGDRIWDVHDVSKFKSHYPEWDYQWSLENIFRDLWQKP